MHRDLKPENVLLDAEGHVRLTDFGLSKECITEKNLAHSFCGTPEYLAPEILRRSGHGKPSDWWSLGALLYEMLTGMPPFYSRDRDRLFEKILHSKLRFPNYFSMNACHLLTSLMNRNPKKRLGTFNDATDVRSHIFFGGIDWIKLEKRELPTPFQPKLKVDVNGVTGTTNFDPEFTGMPIHSPSDYQRRNGAKRKYLLPFENFSFRRESDIGEEEEEEGEEGEEEEEEDEEEEDSIDEEIARDGSQSVEELESPPESVEVISVE